MAEKNDEHMDALNTMEKVIRKYLGIVRASHCVIPVTPEEAL